MTKHKEHTWEPNDKATGKPMGDSGSLKHIGAVAPTPDGTRALAQLCVNRHAKSPRDAALLLVMLDLAS